MTTPKVLFIGLDAAERDLLIKWSDSGDLPNLRALRERSLAGDVEVLAGFGSGAMWPSFATAVSPARHGRYFGSAPTADYRIEKHPQEIKATPFWQSLSAAGRRVAVVNIPYARPSTQLNGVEVVDWAIHNPVDKTPATVPAELATEIEARHGCDPVGPCDAHGLGQSDFGLFRDRLLQRIGSKTDMAVELLRAEPWDLFGVVLDESHCVGHQAWHLHDPNHPDHDPALAERIGDPVLQVYQAIDAAIGRLLREVGPETMVMVASITGMGPNYTANWLLADMLRALDHDRKDHRLQALGALRGLWRRVPAAWRARIRGPARRIRERNVRAEERKRRDAFAMPHNHISGAIRLNVRGREPEGRVEPGEAYENACQRIISHLAWARNMETGEPLVKRFLQPRKELSGRFLEDLPDIFVEWNRNAPIRRVWCPGLGEIANNFTGVRKGDHTTHGLLLISGPGVVRGTLGRTASVMDLAPTLCQWLGVPLGDVDGQPVTDPEALVA